MRFPYPKGWYFWTDAQKQKWMDENGQAIFDEQERARQNFINAVKQGKMKDKTTEVPF